MQMRATAGKMPLFVRDIVMLAFLPCKAQVQHKLDNEVVVAG